MGGVAVVGAYQTRFGKFLDRGLKDLGAEAVEAVLKDAGLTLDQVEAAYVGNAIAGLVVGQEMVRGQVILRSLGLGGVPIVNVENACASGSTAAHLAWTAVASGQVDVALVLGVEKMTHPDKSVSVRAVATALDVEGAVDWDSPSPFMEVYAPRVRAYMERTGATAEDLARVVVKAQANGARNPKAQYGGDRSVEEVLADPLVVPPLTRMMCSPIGDGAAALVLASAELVEQMGLADPIWVEASVLRSGVDPDTGPHGIAAAAAAGYEMAGLGPEDLDVVELHDANAGSELMRYEYLGLASSGGGVDLLRSGDTALGGRLPVNPSGGLLARGHPIGATGVAQLVELTDQLRGRAGSRQVAGASVGLAENGGGWVQDDIAADSVHVLDR